MKWTEEQLQAINEEGSNIIVSAGAGSGKTAVLSERVLRKVSSGVDIRKILMLTFTNEAAGEMKNRIRKKLTKANLKKDLEYLDSAYITTFDAYALSCVKKYHYLLDISSNISIIDSSIIDLEKSKILEDIFLELYEKKDPEFLKLIGDFTNRDDEIIKEAILNIKKSLELKYDMEEYLNNYIANYYNKNYINNLLKEYFDYIKSISEQIENDLIILEEYLEEKVYIKVYDTYSKFLKPHTYEDIYKIKDLNRVIFKDLPEEAISIKDDLKENVKTIMELTKYSLDELKEQYYMTKDYVSIIIKIILELEKRLKIYKKDKEAFEFTDIAKMAIKIVKENKEIKEELKNNYNEILIDEYQDTNDLQEMFINEIANNNVYMVGDIKQSIYRFRNANPDIFKNKYADYSKNIGGKKIDLLKNFRSRKEVLANINEIFNLIMTEKIGKVNYHENHEMHYGNLAYINEGANNYNNNLEILKYDYQDKLYTNSEIEAFTIAKDIKNKLNNNYQVFDFELNTNRNIAYSDFCIILDRGTDMPLYKKIFEYLNIPLEVYKDNNLTEEYDIMLIKNIINLIICIKNKDYGINMRYAFLSIARSFVSNLTDSEIFDLINENTFYNDEIYKKCFKLSLDIDNKSPKLLLEEIIDTFNFYENYLKIGEIEASLTRIDNLFDIASTVENLGFTITHFADYLDKMVKENKEIRYKEKRSSSNCVKIMNIHKSKGLEFPICYFAGYKKSFNSGDLQSRFMYDKKYGILTPFFKEGIGTLFTKELIKNNYYLEEISEKIRLFYVALTRAKEKMIMVIPSFEKEQLAKKEVDYLTGIKYRSFYDFINSISLNLAKYIKLIKIDELGLTKDYEFKNIITNKNFKNSSVIQFIENNFANEIINENHASKTITQILTKEENNTLEYGTKMHQLLEYTNFKEENSANEIIKNLKNLFNFKDATIYQELEFILREDNNEYHGIIDLMLEYESEIKIIDYKLKNIDDEAYKKQLNIYYKYVKSIKNKQIKLYLYSLIDNKVKEIELDQV